VDASLAENPMPALPTGIAIPACPAILGQLAAALNSSDPDLGIVSRLIGKDLALAGHALAIANSPACSVGYPVRSLLHAVNALGAMHLLGLVVMHQLRQALSSADDVELERFWQRSAITARLSAELARRLHCAPPDAAYAFGLFHDCGMALMIRHFPRIRLVLAEANSNPGRLFTEVEQMRLGTNHALVGYQLARLWRLPDFIAEGILYHHDYPALLQPNRVPETACSLIAIGALAGHVGRLYLMGYDEQEWHRARPVVSAHLHLSAAEIDQLVDDLVEWLD